MKCCESFQTQNSDVMVLTQNSASLVFFLLYRWAEETLCSFVAFLKFYFEATIPKTCQNTLVLEQVAQERLCSLLL